MPPLENARQAIDDSDEKRPQMKDLPPQRNQVKGAAKRIRKESVPAPPAYAKYLSLGAQVAVSMLAPIALGLWYDANQGTSPTGFMAGAFFGFVAFAHTIFKLIR